MNLQHVIVFHLKFVELDEMDNHRYTIDDDGNEIPFDTIGRTN